MGDKVLRHIDGDGNATLVLNRPEVHNAFDPEMVKALTSALKDADRDPVVRAVVLMGAGQSFCAGADIGHMKKSAAFTPKQNYQAARESADMLYTLYSLTKPTIACVRGAVRGGGCGLVAACDIALGSRLATFRLSEVKLGIIPSMISPYVIAAMGQRAARRYMLTGEEFDAAEAWRIGLLHDIVEDGDLIHEVGALLTQLHTSGPAAMSAVKRLIAVNAHADISESVIHTTSKGIADIRATPEGQEGLSAFLEKRKPSWVMPAQPKRAAKKKATRKATRK